MKNITISVHDETYHQARVQTAWNNTSVSGLFRQFLEPLSDPPGSALDPMKRKSGPNQSLYPSFRG